MSGERRRRGIIDSDLEMEEGYSPLIASASKSEADEKAYEAVLDEVGFGKFQILLLLVCGWANASDAVEILCVSFVLPSAECELNLSSEGKGVLTAVIFFGMMFGGYMWGSLGDSMGRKTTLVTSLLINSFGGTLSAFASSFELFTFARFLSGLGVGGSVPVIWSYFAEFQVARNRGAMLSLLASSWMVGNILTACLAWVLIPRGLRVSFFFRTLPSWRLFVLICVIPALVAALLLLFFPESPKYLLKSGQGEKAKAVMIYIHRMNRGDGSSPPFQHSALFLDNEDPRKGLSIPARGIRRWKILIVKLFSKSKSLFRPPHSTNNALMLVIFFTISFGYYGMWLWMPELFSMAAKRGNSPCALYSVPFNGSSFPDPFPGPPSLAVDDESPSTSPNCTASPETYRDSLISTIATLPGNLVSIFCVDRIGRKPLMVISMVVSGASVFFIPLVTSSSHLLMLSCFFGGFSVIGWNTLDCLSCELFPTELRSTAIGLQLGLGRVAAILGNIVFGELIVVNCAIPIFLVAICMTVGGLTALKLPQTTGVVLS